MLVKEDAIEESLVGILKTLPNLSAALTKPSKANFSNKNHAKSKLTKYKALT